MPSILKFLRMRGQFPGHAQMIKRAFSNTSKLDYIDKASELAHFCMKLREEKRKGFIFILNERELFCGALKYII